MQNVHSIKYGTYIIQDNCKISKVTSHNGHFILAIKENPATGVSIMGFW